MRFPIYSNPGFDTWVSLSGFGIVRAAKAGSKRTRGYLRLALANLGGPGSLAPVVAPALGLGLALMSLVAVVQTNLLGQLRDTAPANAPSVIFRQIPHEDVAEEGEDHPQGGQGISLADPVRRVRRRNDHQ